MDENQKPESTPETLLERAEAHLEAAKEDLADAKREVTEAAAEVEEAIKEEKETFDVHVVYDGQSKKFTVRSGEKVKRLLDEAIAAFGAGPQPHTLSLFKDGKELNDDNTIKAAGVEPHDKLLLRPSTVKGGA